MWCLASIALLAALVVADASTDSVVLDGSFGIAAIVAAFRCDAAQTAFVAVLGVTAAVAGVATAGMFDDDQSIVRMTVTGVIGALSVAVAGLRTAAAASFERERLLARTGDVLAAPLDLDARIDQVVKLAVPLLADWCAIDLRSGDAITRVAAAHVDPEKAELALELARRWPSTLADTTGVGYVVRTGEALHWEHVDEAVLRRVARDEEEYRIISRLGARSAVVLPLTARGHTLGALALVLDRPKRRFGPGDRALADELARRCADALDAAQLFEQAEAAGRELAGLLRLEREARLQAQRAEAHSDLLAEASAIFEISVDERPRLRLLAELIVSRFADTCTILVSSPASGLHPPVFAALDADVLAALEASERAEPVATRPDDPVRRVLRAGEPAVIDTGPGSVRIIEPLRARARTFGAISATFSELGEDRRETLAVFGDLARRIGLSVDHARLYAERTHVARTLQRSLLPPDLPELPGVELAARYRAAGEGNDVGGDFYDCFAVGDGEWAVVVGDVCGKGAEAAAITALARYTIRASVMHTRRPREVLSELNEAILRHRLDYRFCTVLYASLRPAPEGLRVRMATGGHPPPLVVRGRTGTIEEGVRAGTLIGVVEDPELSEGDVTLGPGDALVLYTDGVIEATPTGAFGPREFAELASSLAGRDADAMAEAIESRVLAMQGGQPRDDVAIVVVRVPTPGDVADAPVAFAAQPAR